MATRWHEQNNKKENPDTGRDKQTSDEDWINAHGTNVVDIANTSYEDLPADWQAENKAAAEVVVGLMQEANGQIDLNNDDHRNYAGSVVHEAWLSRNDWARGGELDVPFAQLPPDEQAKDLNQVVIAQQVFHQ